MKIFLFLSLFAFSGYLHSSVSDVPLEDSERIVVVKSVGLHKSLSELSSTISSQKMNVWLSGSGDVTVTLRDHLKLAALENHKGSVLLSFEFLVDVDGYDVDYSDRLMYSGYIKPYFDYKNDVISFYPHGDRGLTPIVDNHFTGSELSELVYGKIKLLIENKLKQLHIDGVDSSTKSLIESNIEQMMFYVYEDEGKEKLGIVSK